MKKLFASALTLFVVWGTASAVSHIGKGRIILDRYSTTADLPERFQLLQNTSGGVVQLVGPLKAQSISIDRLSILMRPYADAYPDLQFSRDQIVKHFSEKKWQLMKASSDCVTVLQIETEKTISAIALWGNKKGTVISGTRSTATRDAVNDLLNSISFSQEDCSWK